MDIKKDLAAVWFDNVLIEVGLAQSIYLCVVRITRVRVVSQR